MRTTQKKVFSQGGKLVLKKGRVIKIRSGKYFVDIDGVVSEFVAKGALKIKSDGISTGDFVETGDSSITKVLPRKNKLSRPNIANVDLVAVVIGAPPEPDFFLIDKLISVCEIKGIEVAIVVNKSDLGRSTAAKTIENYGKAVKSIFVVSTKTGEGLTSLSDFLTGKLTAFVGQSAVGKTSLLNALFGLERTVGDLSEKTKRGKQTTTASLIYDGGRALVADTPGFTAFDLEVSSCDLPLSYPEFQPFLQRCRFSDCKHLNEPDCAVKDAVTRGEINEERYSRYKLIYDEIIKKQTKNGGR